MSEIHREIYPDGCCPQCQGEALRERDEWKAVANRHLDRAQQALRERDEALARYQNCFEDREGICNRASALETLLANMQSQRDQRKSERDEARAALDNLEKTIEAKLAKYYDKWHEAERERDGARSAQEILTTELRTVAEERDEARALLAEGLARWNSEPRPSLQSAWFDFWAKVRAMTEGES